jgi:Xaa-Pro aminopeptidase
VNSELAAVRRRLAVRAFSESGLDAFIVGQPRNLAYLTGARRVLVRGSRPFAPLAVLVGHGADIWMQSSSAGDIPEDLADRLYPQVWSPQRLVEHVARILTAAGATRAGVDSMTPAWRARLAAALPSVEIVVADEVLRAVRTRKTPEELPVLRRAVAAAADAMAAGAEAVTAGATEAEVRARLASAVVSAGGTLSTEGMCAVLEKGAPLRRLPASRIIGAEDRVALDVSAVVDGYEAGAGRTAAAGSGMASGGGTGGSSARWEELRARLLAACRAGAAGADVFRAAGGAGGFERDPTLPVAYGYGFGPEAPLAPGDELAAGEVLALQARGWESGAAGWYARDMILVGEQGAELLSGEITL